jgi:hypothetical protein
MNTYDAKQYAISAKVMHDETGRNFKDCLEIIQRLHKWERRLSTINTHQCNRELTQWEIKIQETSKEKVKSICEDLGVKVRFNQDPRGCAIKLYYPSGRYNSLDGESWVFGW